MRVRIVQARNYGAAPASITAVFGPRKWLSSVSNPAPIIVPSLIAGADTNGWRLFIVAMRLFTTSVF